jgi:sulfite exporter TauE/SafE
MKSLLLGLSIGGGCIAHCGSVLLPILLCEQQKRWKLTGLFIGSRLLGYLLFAVASVLLGKIIILPNFLSSSLFDGLISIVLGCVLLYYGFQLSSELECDSSSCQPPGKPQTSFERFKKGSAVYATRAGFLTGLSLCAPFLVIMADIGVSANMYEGILNILLFYIGTTVVLLPIMLGGYLSRFLIARQIGCLSAFLGGGIYGLQGIFKILSPL